MNALRVRLSGPAQPQLRGQGLYFEEVLVLNCADPEICSAPLKAEVACSGPLAANADAGFPAVNTNTLQVWQ